MFLHCIFLYNSKCILCPTTRKRTVVPSYVMCIWCTANEIMNEWGSKGNTEKDCMVLFLDYVDLDHSRIKQLIENKTDRLS